MSRSFHTIGFLQIPNLTVKYLFTKHDGHPTEREIETVAFCGGASAILFRRHPLFSKMAQFWPNHYYLSEDTIRGYTQVAKPDYMLDSAIRTCLEAERTCILTWHSPETGQPSIAREYTLDTRGEPFFTAIAPRQIWFEGQMQIPEHLLKQAA